MDLPEYYDIVAQDTIIHQDMTIPTVVTIKGPLRELSINFYAFFPQYYQSRLREYGKEMFSPTDEVVPNVKMSDIVTSGFLVYTADDDTLKLEDFRNKTKVPFWMPHVDEDERRLFKGLGLKLLCLTVKTIVDRLPFIDEYDPLVLQPESNKVVPYYKALGFRVSQRPGLMEIFIKDFMTTCRSRSDAHETACTTADMKKVESFRYVDDCNLLQDRGSRKCCDDFVKSLRDYWKAHGYDPDSLFAFLDTWAIPVDDSQKLLMFWALSYLSQDSEHLPRNNILLARVNNDVPQNISSSDKARLFLNWARASSVDGPQNGGDYNYFYSLLYCALFLKNQGDEAAYGLFVRGLRRENVADKTRLMNVLNPSFLRAEDTRAKKRSRRS